ncbi:MAG: cytochrome c biogenesis protein CcsA [Armatimonadetes bacterium]|nr:cytochrome c biogenesis protein CcsA [Armatimonadota bacterium]
MAVGIIGRASIFIALACLLAAALLWVLKPWYASDSKWPARLFVAGCLSFLAAFGSLMVLFIADQFQYLYIYNHSAIDHELKYKIAAVWSGQEGSFLLWATTSSILGVLAIRGTGKYQRWFGVTFAGILAVLAAIIAFESPFNLLDFGNIVGLDGKVFVPFDGRGLVPSLLNYWVVIHPPTIFFGFSCLTVLFAWSIAALAHRNLTSWIPGVRSWALACLGILGVGLCMGGFWAYETLGWGGFWMWDPVENTSLVPWIAVIVLIHGFFVQTSRGKWMFANVIFAALPFLLFCYGTFMTRSGFLGDTSVHSFAQMDSSALNLLIALLILSIVGFATILAINYKPIRAAGKPRREMDAEPLNRETLYGAGTWILLFFALIIALGMSWPLVLSLTGETPRIVDEGLYHDVLAWFFVPLMIAMAVAPYLTWRGLGVWPLLGKLLNALAVSIGVVGCILLWMKLGDFHSPAADSEIAFDMLGISAPLVSWILFLGWLCIFTAISAAWRIAELWKNARPSIGGMIAHIGVALLIFGLVFSRGFEQQETVILTAFEPEETFGYTLNLVGPTKQLDHRDNKIEISAERSNSQFTAWPGLYYKVHEGEHDGVPDAIVWPHIQRMPLYDLYFTIQPLTFVATDPISFELGQEKLFQSRFLFKYLGHDVVGEFPNTVFFARFEISDALAEFDGVIELIIVMEDGVSQQIRAKLSDNYWVYLDALNVETKDATIHLEFTEAAYPLLVFFKPMTMFVWLGVAVMLIGGFMAAFYRRNRQVDEETPVAK